MIFSVVKQVMKCMCHCVPIFAGVFFFFFFTMAPQTGVLTHGEEKQGRVRKEGGENGMVFSVVKQVMKRVC